MLGALPLTPQLLPRGLGSPAVASPPPLAEKLGEADLDRDAEVEGDPGQGSAGDASLCSAH